MFNFDYLQTILTFLGFFLAYLAYCKSIEDKYDSWKVLIQSFIDEITTAHSWIGGEYKENDYNKNFYNPNKHVFKLTTIAAEEIIRKGIKDLNISDKYRDKIALYIERIKAFNDSIDYISRISTSNPLISQSLIEILKEDGLYDPDINFEDFLIRINEDKRLVINKIKKEYSNEYLLMRQVFNANKNLHQGLISEKINEDRLSYLYSYLKKESMRIVIDIDKKNGHPWFIKNKLLLILFSIICFLVGLYFATNSAQYLSVLS